MEPDTSAAEAALKAKLSRKRTKTGCLTCRKRRIKCGEERPICKNCIKSKRQCEGYSQRLVFKNPTFDYRPTPQGGAHITFPLPEPGAPHTGHQHAPSVYDPAAYYQQHEQQPHGHGAVQSGTYHDGMHAPPPFDTGFQYQQSGQPQPYPPSTLATAAYGIDAHESVFPRAEPYHEPHHAHFGNGLQSTSPLDAHAPGSSLWQQRQPALFQETSSSQAPEHANRRGSLASDAPRHGAMPGGYSTAFEQSQPASSWQTHRYTPRPEYQTPIDYRPPPASASVPHSNFPQPSSARPEQHALYDPFVNGQATPTTSNLLSAAAVEAQDDDYYDVQSDDEMDYEDSAMAMTDNAKQRKLTQLLQRHSISVQELQDRRYDTFIYDGILDHYRVDDHANPLRNRATAMVFAHFIAVTGPSLSIFERHLRNSSVLFSEGQIPFPQQGLWTYTLPLAALRHRGLLHAMLALASLHIARLLNATQTPSMQHYSWAVKRIRHCVGHPKKRLKVTTIAASMLLGFYEIMTADHTKWNMHLAGSKQLFSELEFGDMVRKFRQMKRDRSISQMYSNGYPTPFSDPNDELLDQMYDVDERLVSQIVGREVKYEEHGHVMTPHSSIPPEMDLSQFAMLKDLWWWYCHQDVYQSIVSGNPLLLDYSRWSNCPPRAPLGQPDAVYGSVDHLMLLLGRIADFAARDRKRKLKQMEANGGQWRPPPGMKMPAPPAPPTPVSATGAMPGRTAEFPPPPTPNQKPPELPPFFGMAPPPRTNVTMPYSYMPANGTPSTHSSPSEIGDLEAATLAAKEEHGRIRAALFTFQNSLGEAFQPLSSEYQQELDTPFGKALFFRSYDIGCLWAIFHMATIITIRSHPDMHPAAHAAAALAAPETAFPANEIGRIAAGIEPPGLTDTSGPLNPTLGATLCESCMPAFFAAIQYTNPHQRHATVLRMYNIARRTGWGSIELIANGCETSWVKAAAAGRGPPYTRVVRPTHSADPRLNGSWEALDPDADPDDMDESDRRLVRSKPAARLNWAIGVIGAEEDVVMAD